jgi:hypothetical protein
MQHPTATPIPQFTCGVPINSGPQTYVLRAAIAALNRWVVDGTPPPTSPRMQTTDSNPPALKVDASGIVLGGIRTPAVDAPVARLSGLGQTSGTSFCSIFGTTVPFSDAQLKARYQNHLGFVIAWGFTTLKAALSGFVLPADALKMFIAGAQSNVLR